MLAFSGPGLLVSVGYMDPGNWATDLQVGLTYGYSLIYVILLSSVVGIVLQVLSVRLGVVAQKDLARMCRENYHKRLAIFLWIMAEVAIVACDVAEVIGSALAIHLLFGVSLLVGVAITAFDTMIVLGLKGHGFRQIEATILGLVSTITLCFLIQLVMARPDWGDVANGFIPGPEILHNPDQLYLAIGILGATVMPHNLYLHSSIVQTRMVPNSIPGKRDALRFASLDAIITLLLALFVNAAILTVASATFHAHGQTSVVEIQDAYHLLEPTLGSWFAPLLFGIALLASGQSSTFTGTIAGQVIMEGFLVIKIPCWQRRLITRGLALIPAFIGIAWLGDGGVNKLLIGSQVVLSLQLPFAIWPLIRFTSSRQIMGEFSNGRIIKLLAWILFLLISIANVWLLVTLA
jgi:manganese transport protein